MRVPQNCPLIVEILSYVSIQAATAGPLHEVESALPAQWLPRSTRRIREHGGGGQLPPQALGVAEAGAVLDSTR
jgi:hypothetical protein